MTEQPTVLVVEDEESFVEALVVGLKREGFRVVVARDGLEALERFDAARPDLVLLDVMLPKMSGIDVCREIRTRSRVPIIMVTAKGSEIDTVVGLEVGADDYVTKPYRLRELVARMRAVLRRAPKEVESPAAGEVLEVGDVCLDPERHEVSLRPEAALAGDGEDVVVAAGPDRTSRHGGGQVGPDLAAAVAVLDLGDPRADLPAHGSGRRLGDRRDRHGHGDRHCCYRRNGR